MENEITAHKSGVIVELPITEGAPVAAGARSPRSRRRAGDPSAGPTRP